MTTRTDKYMARVASHLPSLPCNAARREFLTSELAKWEDRYQRFMNTEGDSTPGADAADFVETIAALEIEKARYSQMESA